MRDGWMRQASAQCAAIRCRAFCNNKALNRRRESIRKYAIALVAVLAVLLALAVPCAAWEPDEAKLLGEEPVTRADLPDEWQELSNADLWESMNDILVKAGEHYQAAEYRQAISSYEICIYLGRVIGKSDLVAISLNNMQ